jgi:hypothetical protein
MMMTMIVSLLNLDYAVLRLGLPVLPKPKPFGFGQEMYTEKVKDIDDSFHHRLLVLLAVVWLKVVAVVSF